MKLTVYFYGKDGTSLQSPETIVRGDVDRLDAYAEAVRMREALVQKRGLWVSMHTVES